MRVMNVSHEWDHVWWYFGAIIAVKTNSFLMVEITASWNLSQQPKQRV